MTEGQKGPMPHRAHSWDPWGLEGRHFLPGPLPTPERHPCSPHCRMGQGALGFESWPPLTCFQGRGITTSPLEGRWPPPSLNNFRRNVFLRQN